MIDWRRPHKRNIQGIAALQTSFATLQPDLFPVTSHLKNLFFVLKLLIWIR
jgi:hypothetical protein